MKTIFFLAALFLSVTVNAQFAFRTLVNDRAEYPERPAPPATSNSTLLNISMGSSISQGELGSGKRMGLVPVAGYANTLRFSQLVGTPSDQFYFKSEDDNTYSVVGGATLPNGSNIFAQVGSPVSDWGGFYHLIGLGHNGVGSLTGIRWFGKAGGSNLIVRDVIIEKPQSPGVQFNGNGDAGTYGRMRFEWLSVFGDNAANEFFYGGETSTTGYGIVNNLYVRHAFGTNVGWDGWQNNSTDTVDLAYITVYDAGKANTSGQKSLLQLQNIGNGGRLTNSLFWLAPRAFQIAMRDFTFQDVVFHSAEEGLIQDVVLDAGYATPLATAGGTVTFRRVHFTSSTPRTYAVVIRENQANFVFENCTIDSNIASLYQDQRTDTSTYSITATGTYTLNLPTPVFNNFTYTDPTHARTVTWWYRINHIGFGN